MLNENININLYKISMPVDPTYRVINVHNNRFSKDIFVMTGITEVEYNKIKKLETLDITRGNCKFHIDSGHVLCFGEIDFHIGSEDCESLDTFNWLDNLYIKGICIPSRYDYDKHECVSPYKKYLYTETFKNSVLCRYLHGCLGKPKYTLIFMETK